MKVYIITENYGDGSAGVIFTSSPNFMRDAESDVPDESFWERFGANEVGYVQVFTADNVEGIKVWKDWKEYKGR